MVQHVYVIFTQAERLGVAVGDRLVRVDGYEAGENYPNPCSSEKASQNGEFVFVFFPFFSKHNFHYRAVCNPFLQTTS